MVLYAVFATIPCSYWVSFLLGISVWFHPDQQIAPFLYSLLVVFRNYLKKAVDFLSKFWHLKNSSFPIFLSVGCSNKWRSTKNTGAILIIEVDNVELSFDSKKILYGVYLKAESGKVTGILGRNGCGKTSLLRIIFGELSPKYKNIRIDSVSQKKALFKSGAVAYLPQHQLLPKSIKLSRVFRLFNSNWADFIQLFDSFKVYENHRTNELSSGELRILETYLIITSKKKIVLLDEPFSFIAPLYIEKFKNLINERKEESVFIITDHFYRDILDISNSIYLLKNGYSKLIRSKADLENEGYLNID